MALGMAGNAAASGLLSSGALSSMFAAASGPIGWAKLGLDVLGGVGGLFGSSTKVTSATSSNTSVVGDITFGSAGLNKPLIDLANPVHVGVLLAVVGFSVVIYKKVK